MSRNKGVTVAVTHTPRYTQPLACQLSLYPFPHPPQLCLYVKKTPNSSGMHIFKHTHQHTGPGWLQDLVAPKHCTSHRCISAILNDWLTTLLEAKYYSPNTNGSSVPPHCTQPQHMTSCLLWIIWWNCFLKYFPCNDVFCFFCFFPPPLLRTVLKKLVLAPYFSLLPAWFICLTSTSRMLLRSPQCPPLPSPDRCPIFGLAL